MLTSIKIQNYRNLKHLSIEKLGRVNLIIGKNNTGKTSLLETISIFLHKGNINWLLQLLEKRGESSRSTNDSKRNLINNVKTLSGLFWGRKPGFEIDERILVEGNLQSNSRQVDLFKGLIFEDYISLRFVKFIRNLISDDGTRLSKTQILDEDANEYNFETGIEIASENFNRLLSLENDRLFRAGMINSTLLNQKSGYFTHMAYPDLNEKKSRPTPTPTGIASRAGARTARRAAKSI